MRRGICLLNPISYSLKRDTIADRFAEYSCQISSFIIVDGCEAVTVEADDDVYAFDAFDIVIDVIAVGITIDKSNGTLNKLTVRIYEIFYLGNGKLITKSRKRFT